MSLILSPTERFVHLDASSILASHPMVTTGGHELPVEVANGVVVVGQSSSPSSSSSVAIPQTVIQELSPQQSLEALIAHNTYNSNANQLLTEVKQQNSCHKILSNNQTIRPQLVAFNSMTTTNPSSSSPPTQSSNPSLITDSRQSSEDSGYSEPTPNSKQTSQQSGGSPNQQSVSSGGGRTYAQMASNKDNSLPKSVSNVRTGSGSGFGQTSANHIRSKTLCPYAMNSIDGDCPYPEGQCHYTHGQVCDLCGRSCLDPNDVDQQNKHRDVSNQSLPLTPFLSINT